MRITIISEIFLKTYKGPSKEQRRLEAVLERFNVVGTEKTQQHVIMLISSVTGRDASDDNDWISSWYDHVMDAYKSKKETSSESFYIEDDLISIRRYDEVTGV